MNNRIIKFKAWKECCTEEGYKMDMIYNPTISELGFNEMVKINDIGKGLILMQYTNLKDKNGKEIYENDIIETKGYVTVVRYEAPKFCCRYDKGNAGMMDFDPFEECKVIGNVYQNPELLNKN